MENCNNKVIRLSIVEHVKVNINLYQYYNKMLKTNMLLNFGILLNNNHNIISVIKNIQH